MSPAQSVTDPVLPLLERRRRGAMHWREPLRQAVSVDAGVATVLTALEASERLHAERLTRELPLLQGADWADIAAGVARGAGPAPARQPAGQSPIRRAIDALERASGDGHRLRTAFERLAAGSADAELRLRALALALAESRHLEALAEALAALRCKL